MMHDSTEAPTTLEAVAPTRAPDVLLSLSRLSKTFHPRRHAALPVLRGVDLEVRRGEAIAVIGPSGSGKSTALRCINLLERPDSGSIRLDGKPVFEASDTGPAVGPSVRALRDLRRRVGMVFQGFHLFPTMSVLANVTMPQVRSLGRGRADAERRSLELLEKVGLADKANARPQTLSGGQQQRVAIARALALDPEVMLFDEPTSAIDPELRIEVLRVMRGLAEAGMTMIVVTHELQFARQVADRIVFFDAGTVLECGPPEQVLDRPRHERVRHFLTAVSGALGNGD
ncbi:MULTISPECIES: amino acid ABC transporter ATP-binding protein [Streptomyces violaceusniger group]|nr:amino acid ABC transporter ATP-binding protein [Streptomyces javensis]